MSLVFDPTTGELIDDSIIDSLSENRKRAIQSVSTTKLLSFEVDKQKIFDNEEVTFSWEVQSAEKVKLIYAQNSQEVQEEGSLSLSLYRDTEVKLSYESIDGTKFESETIKVKVYPAPKIQFDLSEKKIEIGSSIKINWNVENSTKVQLYNGHEGSEVLESGELEVEPLCNTTYKLIVTASDNVSIIETVSTVQVFGKPKIIFFKVDKQIAFESENVSFSWEVQSAKKVKLIYAHDSQEVPEQGRLSMSLFKDTEVKLLYESYNGTKYESEIIKVKVYPAPVIQFDISEKKIEIGSSIKINWIVKNSTKVQLYNGYEELEVLESGELEAKPLCNTTYKLIVTALDNSSIIETVSTVEVFGKPKILFFNAEPDVVLDCVPVTISWNVENAKRVTIDNGIGEVEPIGTKTFPLEKPRTSFTLNAYGELSDCSQELIVRLFPTPLIESLKITMPDFSSRLSLSSVVLNPPNINVSINLPNFNLNIPEYITPNIPLNRIKPEYKPKMSIFNFSKLYERIRNKSKI